MIPLTCLKIKMKWYRNKITFQREFGYQNSKRKEHGRGYPSRSSLSPTYSPHSHDQTNTSQLDKIQDNFNSALQGKSKHIKIPMVIYLQSLSKEKKELNGEIFSDKRRFGPTAIIISDSNSISNDAKSAYLSTKCYCPSWISKSKCQRNAQKWK